MKNMKMKFSLLLLCFLLVLPIFTDSAAHASESKSAVISIPVTNGLTGANNSAKTFYLDMPSGVSSTMIKSGAFKYNGDNSVVGAITIENGNIKVTLKGKEIVEKISNVKGFHNDYENPYITTPGNSIWRYSDGRRWQINDYKAATNTMDSYDLNATDSTVPSADPPLRMITTQSLLGTDGLSWYNNSSKLTIDSASIIQSTVKVLEYSDKVYKKTPNIKGVSFKNQRIIIDYMIPRATSDEASYPTPFLPEPDDGHHDLSGHAEGRRYQVTGYYYYLADAKVTSYSYSGSISFDYSLPTEPTLDGSVAVVSPSPNPAKDEGKDIPVTLKITGDLLAYTDNSNIMEWVFYAKESDSSAVSTKKDGTKVLASSRAFDNFIIPKAKFAGGDFEQEYTVTVTVRFSKPVITSAGSITSLSKTMKARVGVSKTPVNNPPPSGSNKPPVAVLDIPDSVMAGEEFLVYGKLSYDPDGRIENYKYATPGAIDTVTGEYGFTWYPLSEVGNRKSINLRVTDNDGLSASTSAKLEVNAPIPRAAITILGTKKENRKVTLHNASHNPAEHFPIVDEKTRFTIEAVSGGTAADIKYGGTLNGTDDKDVVFKKAGTYKATIYVENNVGYSDVASITFDIVPDEPPVVYFAAPSKIFRDPANGNIAPASLIDMSFSPDYDFIGHRKWEYRYDAENDGDFSNNAWTTFSDANLSTLTLSLTRVGKYEVRLTATEEFDQPTIDEFVTAADRRSINSYNSVPAQPLAERVIEVYNRAPVVDWTW